MTAVRHDEREREVKLKDIAALLMTKYTEVDLTLHVKRNTL